MKTICPIPSLGLLLFLAAESALAQTPGTAPEPDPNKFAITDNSFLVEEAFNQEPRIVQNIFGAMRANGGWTSTFTQEWPLGGKTHQLSYTVAFVNDGSNAGIGDTLLNYRYQVLDEGPGRPAFAPRLSLVLPSGNADKGLGNGATGLQTNLPFSKQRGGWYWHWNAGLTWLHDAEATFTTGDLAVVRRGSLTSPFLAASGIYRLKPMFNLMLESVISFDQSLTQSGTARDTTFTLSPGFRGGWNIGEKQVVTGFAMPVSWTGGASDVGAFLYFSYELPFAKK